MSLPAPSDLSILQSALWPSVRQALKAAYKSAQPAQVISAWEMAANCELEALARQDLLWQSEAFLDSERRQFLRQSCQFHALGLDWSQLAPVVAEASRSRVEKWAASLARSPGAQDSPDPAVGFWLTSCAFLACVGVGVFPPNQIPTYKGGFAPEAGRFSPLPGPLRARCAQTLLAMANDNAPRVDRLSNKEVFDHFFTTSASWDSGCALWGFQEDFIQELSLIAHAADIESATGPGSARRPARRV